MISVAVCFMGVVWVGLFVAVCEGSSGDSSGAAELVWQAARKREIRQAIANGLT